MMDKIPAHPVAARPDGHLERVERQPGTQRTGDLPADDHPGKQVKDERGTDKARRSVDISNVSDPAAVRGYRGEIAFQQVRRPLLASRAGHSRPRPLLRRPQALQAHLAHQPLSRAPRDLDPVAIQLAPHLLRAVKLPPFLLPYPHYFPLQLLVALVPRGRILLSLLRRIVS